MCRDTVYKSELLAIGSEPELWKYSCAIDYSGAKDGLKLTLFHDMGTS
ncbi:MAG: hypothetical protein ACI8TA_001047 [Cyclobacteriaceae bacterium]|jgi:hypothetical protein